MSNIVYNIDYSALSDLTNYVQNNLSKASNLRESISVAKDYAIQKWITTAESKFTHSQGGYARSLVEGVKYPFQNDPFHARIEPKGKIAYYLEKGVQPFDLKKMLQTSNKVRISKDGKKYLVIPFRHGTPGSKTLPPMPEEVYKEARNLKESAITGTFREGIVKQAKSYEEAEMLRQNNPDRVRRNIYAWGEKIEGLGGIYEGMYRFQKNPTINRMNFDMGKFTGLTNTTGNVINSSHYMTFRVMIEDGGGWMHPGIKPMGILKETVAQIETPILRMMADAAKMDLQEVLKSFGDEQIN